jgi:hypothetical protein
VRALRAQVQRHGVIAWLDPTSQYRDLARSLAEDAAAFPHPLVCFDGSWLAWLLSLGERPLGVDPQPLVLYLPGMDSNALRETPAFSLLETSRRFERELEAVVRDAATGRITPERIDDLRRSRGRLPGRGRPLARRRDPHPREAARAAVYAEVSATVLLDDLLARASGSRERKLPTLALETDADLEGLASHLHVVVGMSPAWRAFCDSVRGRRPADICEQIARLVLDLASWVLSVEYVHDLARPPFLAELAALRALPDTLVLESVGLAQHLRRAHGRQYAGLADEVENLLRDTELAQMRAEDLGAVDTFRHEEQVVLRAAVSALRESRWATADEMSEARLERVRSYWLSLDDPWSHSRRAMWQIVRQAASLGLALDGARQRTSLRGESLEACADRYAAELSRVDRAHRHFEQYLATLLDPRMEHYVALQDVARTLRSQYRRWADELARAFTAQCRERGFLPEPRYQQRTLYEQVVQPLVERGLRVAVFLVDAFRYEMADELAGRLRAAGRVVDLKPRLAELPTVTAVGMNAIAPVARLGRLEVAGEFQGFRTGEFTVARPDDRARAIGQRSLGKSKALLLDLATITGSSPEKDLASQVRQRMVVVVQSREIDDAGEANVGVRSFDGVIRDLTAAWHLLHGAGVDVCVFTADHGFLLQDETTHVQPFGTKRDPRRRYVLDPHPRAEAGMANVALSALGYDGLEGYLLLREDTAVFATGNSGATFVHGGNSLQERVVPVLVVEASRAKTPEEPRFRIVAEARSKVVGLHRVLVRVEEVDTDASRPLPLTRPSPVEVALRVAGRDDIGVLVRDASVPEALKGSRVAVPVAGEGVECFFALEGARDERVQVEFFHPDNPKRVTAAVADAWFDVAGIVRTADPEPAAPARAVAWHEQIADAGVRAVFQHIEKHRMITEEEATRMLGSPRAFRRFSSEFDANAAKVPFVVRVDVGAGGKTYLRDDDR